MSPRQASGITVTDQFCGAGGSWCKEHGIGVLLIVSPAEAAKSKSSPHDNGRRLTVLRCVSETVRRVFQRAFSVRTTIIASPAPPMDPRQQ